MENIERYFTGKYAGERGATWWDILYGKLKQFAGNLLNGLGVPGFVRPLEIQDTLTNTYVQVRVSGFFTVISIDGRDYYFRRLTGEYDGSGISVAYSKD